MGKRLSQGTTRLSSVPQNLRKIKVTGKMGAIVSELEKDGHNYLAIVNKSPNSQLKVSIKALNRLPCRITKKLKEEPLKASYAIAPGDILIIKLK